MTLVFFLFQINQNVLSGVFGTAIDDAINTGNQNFENQEEKATSSFITTKQLLFLMRFLELLIEKNEDAFNFARYTHSQITKNEFLYTGS